MQLISGLFYIFLYIFEGNASHELTSDISHLKSEWIEIVQKTNKWITPNKNRDFQNYTRSPCQDIGSYDFIVVGAGSTGAVIANRLSKDSKTELLLIEAGGEETTFSLVPLNLPHLLKTEKNWDFRTTPQKNSCLIKSNHQCPYNRGKSLGGSSAINGMIMSRANKQDFDKWVQLGNTEWSFKKILKYYKRSETVTGYGKRKSRGRNGPTYVTKSSPKVPLHSTLKMAYKEVNIQENRDYNGITQMGFSLGQSNIKKGIRQSTNQVYLEPVKYTRRNLHILTHAFATNIEFNNNEASKIKILHEGVCKVANVKKEIIISAGVINSPHLLQLSGIGPKNLLQKYNIEMVKDLPVGENFQDHPCILHGIEIFTNVTLDQKSFEEELIEYVNGEGRLATLFMNHLSYHNLNGNSSSEPDIEYVYRLNYHALSPTLRNSTYKAKFDISLILINSSSKGSVKIRSANPIDYPLIDPNYLDSPIEIGLVVDAIDFLNKIVRTPSFQKIGARLNINGIKTKECQKIKERRKFWACIIRYIGEGCSHGSSTCSMGPKPETSVVDQKLKVHGIKNLRVADASIFPISLSGHVHANALMVGEKASDLILSDPRWKN